MKEGRTGLRERSHLALEEQLPGTLGNEVTRHLRKARNRRRFDENQLKKIMTFFKLKGALKVIKFSPPFWFCFSILIIQEMKAQKREFAEGHSRTQLICHKVIQNFLNIPAFVNFINT